MLKGQMSRSYRQDRVVEIFQRLEVEREKLKKTVGSDIVRHYYIKSKKLMGRDDLDECLVELVQKLSEVLDRTVQEQEEYMRLS